MRRAVLIIVLLLALAAPASSSPQPLADRTAAWLTQQLGVEVPTQRIHAIPTDGLRPWAAASFNATPRYVKAEDWLVKDWSRPWRPDMSPEAGRILLHELLHGLSEDEGAVDAVALDLFPAWSKRFTPASWRMYRDVPDAWRFSGYPGLTRNVRGLSAEMTGKPWRSREARLFRRAWLLR